MSYQNKLILFTSVKNSPGVYEKLVELQKKMKILGSNEIALTFNALDHGASKSVVNIYFTLLEKDEKKAVKGFMEFINGCAYLFKIPSTSKNHSWADKIALSTIPYPNSRSINTIDELQMMKTPNHTINLQVFRTPGI
jgi:hypothetical protein